MISPRSSHAQLATRVGALDGLRGLAVAGVVTFHTEATWAKGGYLGVSLFFTLSGFLITSGLLGEAERTGQVDRRSFWTRRFRRLWPAATLTVLGVLVANAVLGTVESRSLAADALGALANVANWRFLFDGTSYQDLFTAPSPLLHFWSLAIEEQFYLVFPLLAGVLLVAGRRRALLGLVAMYVASAVAQVSFSEVNRVYLGTGTRASEILIGSLLAWWWSRHETTRAGEVAQRVLRWVAPLVAVGIGWSWATLRESSTIWTQGAFLVVGLGSVIVVAAAMGGDSLFCRVLEIPPLRWLGERSYGIYLFHWPIFVFWSPGADGTTRWYEWIPRLVLVCVLAEASARLIELPIRQNRLLDARFWPTVAVTSATVLVVLGVYVATTDAPTERFDVRADPPPFVPPSTATTSPADVTSPDPTTAATTTTPPRLAVFGDSTASAAADGLVQWSETFGEAFVYDISKPSCPISEYQRYQQSPAEATHPRNPECEWRGRFDTWLGDFDPDLVVVIGGTSEIVDFSIDGDSWTNITTAEGYDFVRSEMADAANEIRGASPDARVVLTTAPYNDWLMCQQPCLTHDRSRFDRYNELVSELVRSGIYDSAIDYAQHINGLALDPTDPRRPDGVHLSEEGSFQDATDWLGPQLLEELR